MAWSHNIIYLCCKTYGPTEIVGIVVQFFIKLIIISMGRNQMLFMKVMQNFSNNNCMPCHWMFLLNALQTLGRKCEYSASLEAVRVSTEIFHSAHTYNLSLKFHSDTFNN